MFLGFQIFCGWDCSSLMQLPLAHRLPSLTGAWPLCWAVALCSVVCSLPISRGKADMNRPQSLFGCVGGQAAAW